MAWFRRTRLAPPPEPTDAGPSDAGPTDGRHLPVPAASAPALARTERALMMLAAQSSQLHASVVALEHRVDALAEAMLAETSRPSYDDLLAARLHSARVAGELARLEVNIAARLEAVQDDVRTLRGEEQATIDLRDLTPTDTGWSRSA